jgi:hypothetical protein
MSNASVSNPVNTSFRSLRKQQRTHEEFEAAKPSTQSKFAKRASSFKDSIFAPYPASSVTSSNYTTDNLCRYHESSNRLVDASLGTIQGGDPSLLDIIDDPYAYDSNGLRHKSFLVEHEQLPQKSTLQHTRSHVHLSYCPVHSGGDMDVRYLNDVSANLNRSSSFKGSLSTKSSKARMEDHRVDVYSPNGLI